MGNKTKKILTFAAWTMAATPVVVVCTLYNGVSEVVSGMTKGGKEIIVRGKEIVRELYDEEEKEEESE